MWSSFFTRKFSLAALEPLVISLPQVTDENRVSYGKWWFSQLNEKTKKATNQLVPVEYDQLCMLVQLGRSAIDLYKMLLENDTNFNLPICNVFREGNVKTAKHNCNPVKEDIPEKPLLSILAFENVKEEVRWHAVLLHIMKLGCSEFGMQKQEAEIEAEMKTLANNFSKSDCWCLLISSYLYEEFYGFNCCGVSYLQIQEKLGVSIDSTIALDEWLPRSDPTAVLYMVMSHKIDTDTKLTTDDIVAKCCKARKKAEEKSTTRNLVELVKFILIRDHVRRQYIVNVIKKLFLCYVQSLANNNKTSERLILLGADSNKAENRDPKPFNDMAELNEFSTIELFNIAISKLIPDVAPEQMKMFALCQLVCESNRALICEKLDKSEIEANLISEVVATETPNILAQFPQLIPVLLEAKHRDHLKRLCRESIQNIIAIAASKADVADVIYDTVKDDYDFGYEAILQCLNANTEHRLFLAHASSGCYACAIGTWSMNRGSLELLKSMAITKDNINDVIRGMMKTTESVDVNRMKVLDYVTSLIKRLPLDTSHMKFKPNNANDWHWREDPCVVKHEERQRVKSQARRSCRREHGGLKNIWELPPDVCTECTYSIYGREYIQQPWFYCYTCGMVEHEGACLGCAMRCHKGHDLSYASTGGFFCDCQDGQDICEFAHPELQSHDAQETKVAREQFECDGHVLLQFLEFLVSAKISNEAESLRLVTQEDKPYEVPLTFWTFPERNRHITGIIGDMPIELLIRIGRPWMANPWSDERQIRVIAEDECVIVGFEIHISDPDEETYSGGGHISFHGRKYPIGGKRVVLIPLKPSEVSLPGSEHVINLENDREMLVNFFSVFTMDPGELMIPDSDDIDLEMDSDVLSESNPTERRNGETLLDLDEPNNSNFENAIGSVISRVACGVAGSPRPNDKTLVKLITSIYALSQVPAYARVPNFIRRAVVATGHPPEHVTKIWASVIKDVLTRNPDDNGWSLLWNDAQKLPDDEYANMSTSLWKTGEVKITMESCVAAFMAQE